MMENLQAGSSGQEVIKLQQQLQELGFDPGSTDGIFSEMTEAAVKAFQDSEGLAPDGIAGIATLEALGLTY